VCSPSEPQKHPLKHPTKVALLARRAFTARTVLTVLLATRTMAVKRTDAEWKQQVRRWSVCDRFVCSRRFPPHSPPPPPPLCLLVHHADLEQLSAKEYHVLREKGTEAAGTGEYDKLYPKQGYFACRACGAPLYSATAKFRSGCGWPAFDQCFKGARMRGCGGVRGGAFKEDECVCLPVRTASTYSAWPCASRPLRAISSAQNYPSFLCYEAATTGTRKRAVVQTGFHPFASLAPHSLPAQAPLAPRWTLLTACAASRSLAQPAMGTSATCSRAST
jgi:hypothetical protein